MTKFPPISESNSQQQKGDIFTQVIYGSLGNGISPQNFQTNSNNFEQC